MIVGKIHRYTVLYRICLLQKKLSLLQHFHERLRTLPHHQALFLLKASFGSPRFIHTLRTTPCWSSPTLIQMDNTLKEIIEEILNINLSEIKWTQATLPVSKGGLGIRSFSQLSLPAFIASATGTSRLVDTCLAAIPVGDCEMYTEAINKWTTATNTDVLPESILQKEWDKPLCEAQFQSLLSHLNTTEKATAHHSGDWLHAMPISKCGFALSNDEIRISVCLRLGLPIYGDHHCKCGEEVDPLGQHCFTCKRNNGKHARHSAMNQLIKRELNRCYIPSQLEPAGLLASNQLRPDGITVCPWSRGKQLVWDFTCTHSLSSSNLRATDGESGKAAEFAERRKMSKYAALPQHLLFMPLAIETLGAYGPQATQFFKDLSRRHILALNNPVAGCQLMQRVSIGLQKGNASCVMFSLH